MDIQVTFLPIVIRPYSRWSDELLVLGSAKIAKAMAKNPNFTTLHAQIVDYTILQIVFAKLHSDAEFRDTNVIAKRNDARKSLVASSIKIGDAVQKIAGTDLTALISSGIPLRRVPQTIVLRSPSYLDIRNGTNAGELIAKVPSIRGASVYNFYYTIDPLGDTPRVSSSKSKIIIPGFKPGTCVWFKVQVVGEKGQSPWSAEQLSPYVQNRNIKK